MPEGRTKRVHLNGESADEADFLFFLPSRIFRSVFIGVFYGEKDQSCL